MTYPLKMGRKFPVITIDHEKCTIPFMCKKCLQVCPEVVFHVTRVMPKEKRLEEMDPRVDGNYVLGIARRDKCTGCNLCIDICPVGAIKIEIPAMGRIRPKVEGEQWNQ
ncbi:MAG TPA: 4Fe-4S dicluster domain-containing protein [Dehalococcoidia bacterium]|nr:4Fe-4S dicluster domain-containing protein [Dehalococcoidia bacterium]